MTNLAEQNLYSFYQQSYHQHLGVQLPTQLEEMRLYKSFDSYLQNTFSYKQVQKIQKHLNLYKTNKTVYSKISPLINFIKSSAYFPQKLLDFGCGRGETTKFLVENLKSLEYVWGVDIDRGVLERCQTNLHGLDIKTTLSTNLNRFSGNHQRYDLIILIHTLHHVDRAKQISLIDNLRTYLAPQGLLYIYEDSWSVQLQSSSHSSHDNCFENLPLSLKQKTFTLNEYWANEWCYGRVLSANEENYRSLEEWEQLLNSLEMKVLQSDCNGFDVNRLHGVPSAWLVATC